MKSKMKHIVIMMSVIFIAFGCSMPGESVKTEPYTGKALHIGIIGEQPTIREKNIQFTDVNFTDLRNAAKYDAIFITKENLVEAAKPQYAAVYTNSSIPFLFIETEKGYKPFIDNEIDYEDYPNVASGAYAYLYDGKSAQYWGYGLYNDIENEQNIQDVYSRVFEAIEDLSDTN